MAIGIQEIAFLVITVLFGVLLGLFILQTMKRDRSARALIISLFFGFLACVFAIFSSRELFTLGSLHDILQALQLNTFGLQFFFFFIFFERLRSKDIHTGRLTIMVSLLLLQTMSLWLRIYFEFLNIAGVDGTLWFLQDMGYSISGLFVYIGFSMPIYLKTYKYTHERKPLFIMLALALVGIGFIFSFFKDLFDFTHVSIEWLDNLAIYTMPLQAIGLFIFTSIYLSDIDYLYRLPNDTFMLMVLTKSGIPLHTVKLKTRKQVEIAGDLLSGILSAINNVFKEVFKTESTIQNISSQEIHLLMESGEVIVSLVVTDKISFFLDKALKRYTTEFEKKFEKELKAQTQDIAAYYKAKDLIKPVFPFFIVDKVIQD